MDPVRERCRVCGSSEVVQAGHVEYLRGFDWPVFDCHGCGCRLTPHDSTVHQKFHSAPAISYYAEYVDLARTAAAAFAARDRRRLAEHLRQWSKYRFVLEEIAREPAAARILEVGCSRGYLTACSILEGRNILGVDVSEAAVTAARDAFGDHFALADSSRAMDGRPYDLVYHVGMIGCVGDPIGLTRQLLALVKPGGRLIFNAPNVAALHLREQLWFDTTPPPDLVTLFPEGFWKRRFSNDAKVRVSTEMLPSDRSASLGLRRLFGRRWRPPSPLPMEGRAQVWTQPQSPAWSVIDRAISRVARPLGLAALAPRRPTEFGLFVQMTSK